VKKIDKTMLNDKKIEIRVFEGLVKEGGIFSANYITFRITTSPVNFDVRRKDADFYFLKKMLNKQFPHIIVPPLLPKTGKLSQKSITKRERYYSRFLQAVTRSEELKSSKYLLEFLMQMDVKKF
jgi:hypothetical protein